MLIMFLTYTECDNFYILKSLYKTNCNFVHCLFVNPVQSDDGLL